IPKKRCIRRGETTAPGRAPRGVGGISVALRAPYIPPTPASPHHEMLVWMKGGDAEKSRYSVIPRVF
ncbi:hypothetical protein L7E55_12695, partial [Pelotomaculum isophthalicicum JI]